MPCAGAFLFYPPSRCDAVAAFLTPRLASPYWFVVDRCRRTIPHRLLPHAHHYPRCYCTLTHPRFARLLPAHSAPPSFHATYLTFPVPLRAPFATWRYLYHTHAYLRHFSSTHIPPHLFCKVGQDGFVYTQDWSHAWTPITPLCYPHHRCRIPTHTPLHATHTSFPMPPPTRGTPVAVGYWFGVILFVRTGYFHSSVGQHSTGSGSHFCLPAAPTYTPHSLSSLCLDGSSQCDGYTHICSALPHTASTTAYSLHFPFACSLHSRVRYAWTMVGQRVAHCVDDWTVMLLRGRRRRGRCCFCVGWKLVVTVNVKQQSCVPLRYVLQRTCWTNVIGVVSPLRAHDTRALLPLRLA